MWHLQVLDVTKWLDKHPGGKSVLLKVSSSDAIKAVLPQRHLQGDHSAKTVELVGKTALLDWIYRSV